MIPTLFLCEITYYRDSDKFRYIPTRDYVRLWDDSTVIYPEASRKCYQFHNATKSLRVVDVEHCPMGTRFLLCKDKMLRPNQKWTNGNKTKVSDIQVNKDQQEKSIDDCTSPRMAMMSPGVYGHHQFNATEQQQMAYLKIKIGQKCTNPHTQSFSDSARRWNPIAKRGPYTVQYNGSLPCPNQSGMVENNHHSPPDAETLKHRDAVSEIKRQLHFVDRI